MYLLQSKVVYIIDVVLLSVGTWDVGGHGWVDIFNGEQFREFIVNDTLLLSVGLMLCEDEG